MGRLVEYRNHRNPLDKSPIEPGFISLGGLDHNDSDMTYVGWISEIFLAETYVPDGIVFLDSASYIARSLQLKESMPYAFIFLDSADQPWGYDADGYPLKMSDDSCAAVAIETYNHYVSTYTQMEAEGTLR